MQRSVVVRLDVGGTPMATSLATVMEGARQGGDVFQALCAQVLGPGWTEYQGGGAVPGELVAQQTDAEHFVDCEPDVFRIIINYLRDGAVPSAELHLLSNVRAYAAKIGMQELAHQVALRHSRQQVMKLLNSQQRNLSGMDLREMDLSDIDFSGANLYRTRLCSAHLRGADFSGANLCGADLTDATCFDANLRGARINRQTRMTKNMDPFILMVCHHLRCNASCGRTGVHAVYRVGTALVCY
jgi:hypothetical protein